MRVFPRVHHRRGMEARGCGVQTMSEPLRAIVCHIEHIHRFEQHAAWYRKGLRQARCPECQLWLFPAEEKEHKCEVRKP
jgi:hypothetical protein